MKISICKKRENIYIVPFIIFYLDYLHYEFDTIKVCSLSNGTKPTPDYYIEKANILIEVKEVYDKYGKYYAERWVKSIERIRPKIVDKMKEQNIRGVYEIPISYFFGFRKADRKKEECFINKTLEMIKNGNYKMISNKETKIYFIDIGHFRGENSMSFYDKTRIALNDILIKANRQLENEMGLIVDKKILLLVNYIINPFWKITYREVINSFDRKIISNIDEIWLQYGKSGQEKHKQVYP